MGSLNSFVKLFPLLLFSVILSGCSIRSDKKIGLLLHDMEGRWFTDVKYLQEYADQSGYELIIKIARGDENLQLAQAGELIKEGVGVIIVVAVNQNTAAGIVRKAHDANIKVIAYDRIIKNSELDYLLTYEYYKIGEMMADYVTNIHPNGNYVELWGDASDNNALAIKNAQEKSLSSFVNDGRINVVYKAYIESWSAENARHVMKKVLDFSAKDIDVVLASNDIIAQTVIGVFEAEGYQGKVLITGQDASLESCRLIVRNKQSMTIYKSTRNMAKEAIELAGQVMKGEKIKLIKGVINNGRKDVPSIFLTPVIVTANNIKETVIADGMFSEQEIYSN